ncbi:MAG TPA: CHAT domain-containing protein [Saprospiraceae bacterium]|nr:CHAT domain-containing protein [Saprospiraceae bacterium]
MPTTSDLLSQAKFILSLRSLRFLIFLWGTLGHFYAGAQSLREAEALSKSGLFLESIEKYEQFIAQNPRRTYDHSVAWFGIGYNYLQLRDYAAALDANQRSKTIREQLPVDDVAENYMRFGDIYLHIGDYEKALSNLRQAKSLPVVEPYMFAQVEGLMADAYLALGNYREAEAHYQLALESFAVESGEFSPDVVTVLLQLGKMYQIQGRKPDAKETFLRALRVEETLSEHAARLGLLFNGLGESALSESRSPAARSYFLRARAAIGQEGSAHYDVAASIALNLSKAALADGDRGLAAAEVMEAQRILFPGFLATDFLQNPDTTLPCLHRVLAAEVCLQKANCLQGAPAALPSQGTAQYYSEAFRLLEAEALTFPSDERRRHIMDFLPQLADEAIQTALRSDDKLLAPLAFEWAERAKALSLKVQIAAPAFPSNSQPAQLLRQWTQLELQLLSTPENIALVKRLNDVQKAYRESLTGISPGNRNGAGFSVSSVQAQLDDATAMISYYIGAEQYYTFALTRNDFKALAIPFNYTTPITRSANSQQPDNTPFPTLRQSVAGLFDALRNTPSGNFAPHASDLYDKLIQPVRQTIAGKKNLVIIPHDILNHLPFEALLTSPVQTADKKTHHKLPYLIKTHTIQYHFTAAAWPMPGRSSENALAYTAWAPVFDSPETQSALADAMRRSELPLPHLSVYGVPDIPTLSATAAEVQALAQIWSRLPGGARTWLRQDATESSARDMAGQTQIAHFATYSIAHPLSPRWAGLILTPAGNDDGILHAAEIQTLHWTGALCVLNISYDLTGQSPYALLPLTYAFSQAGAGGVVSALWTGHDQVRIRMLTDFFSRRSAGLSTADALSRAKLALIKDKTTADPSLWSGLIYFGN